MRPQNCRKSPVGAEPQSGTPLEEGADSFNASPEVLRETGGDLAGDAQDARACQ